MFVAIGWTTYMSARAMWANPDVVKDLANRGAAIKDSDDLARRGSTWLSSHNKHLPKDPSQISIFSRYQRRFE